MQRKRARVNRQQRVAQHMDAEPSFSKTLECTESKETLSDSPTFTIFDRQASDASAETTQPVLPLQPLEGNSMWTGAQRQVYIGSSHCPIDGWYQACRVCNLWTAAELEVAGKVIPLCKGCQMKCHDACAKASSMAQGPANTIAATSSALLALDQAWEDYLNKIRRENNMACR